MYSSAHWPKNFPLPLYPEIFTILHNAHWTGSIDWERFEHICASSPGVRSKCSIICIRIFEAKFVIFPPFEQSGAVPLRTGTSGGNWVQGIFWGKYLHYYCIKSNKKQNIFYKVYHITFLLFSRKLDAYSKSLSSLQNSIAKLYHKKWPIKKKLHLYHLSGT